MLIPEAGNGERLRHPSALVVPKDWQMLSVAEVCQNIIDFRGRTPRKLGFAWGGGDIPALSARNVKMNSIDLTKETYYGSAELYKRWMTNGDARRGDIVITTEAPLGNVAVIPDDGKYILSQRTVLLQVNPAIAESAFLVQAMMSGPFQRQLVAHSSGSTAAGIQRRRLERLELPIPPAHEQRAIATALGDVDASIHVLEKLIAKKVAIKQASMHGLVGGKVRLPGFRDTWQEMALKDLLRYERPDAYIVRSNHYRETGAVPVLTANKSFVLGYTDEEDGVYSDTPAIIFDDFTTDAKFVTFPFKVKSSAIKILKPKSAAVDLRFIFEAMRLIAFSLGGHKRYYISEYQHRKVSLPTLDEQRAIASAISDFDAEISLLERRLAKLMAIKQGMMRSLLTGHIRLAR